MPLIWDRANVRHIARHKVEPREVEEVLTGFTVELDYQHLDGEHRYRDVGVTLNGRILEVVSTDRGEGVRPITAFDAGEFAVGEYLRSR